MIFNITTAAREIPRASFYNPRQRLIIYVHGFIEDPSGINFQTVNRALMKIGESNVIALDCSSLIRTMYLRSSTYVRFIGEKLGTVVAALTTNGLDPSNIYLAGHSLGAHITGFAGKTYTALTGHKVSRISGIDPAGPCFYDVDPNMRLKATDGAFVDVIHTDAGVFGLGEQLGHVDFYPNEGRQQPDCVSIPCSHLRSWMYYAESAVRPKAFPALRCRDWDAFKAGQCEDVISYMGYHCANNSRGQFFLQTGGISPYGLGRDGLTYVNNEGIVKPILELI